MVIPEVSMSKFIVGVMMLVVIGMFAKGLEVLGPSNTNYTIEYKGPKKTTEQRWNTGLRWMKERQDEQ